MSDLDRPLYAAPSLDETWARERAEIRYRLTSAEERFEKLEGTIRTELRMYREETKQDLDKLWHAFEAERTELKQTREWLTTIAARAGLLALLANGVALAAGLWLASRGAHP